MALQQADIGNMDFFKVAEDKDVLQIRDKDGETVLMRAVIGGHLECCKVILGKWPDLLYKLNNGNDTALIYAIHHGKIECVKFFAAVGKPTLFRMEYSSRTSPLHYAIERVELEMVKILIESDPDFDSIPANKNGETPQMLAVRLASTKTDRNDIRVQIKDWMIKKLEEKKAEPDPIDRATKGDADFFRRAQVKECVESRDKNGNSVLSVAVLNEHFECSKVILVRFPELLYIESTNENTHTPLHHAVWGGIPLIVKLLAVGANKKLFKMQNISGSTPMHMAVWKKRLEIVKILAKADPDYNQLPADNNGETPLMIAQRLASGKTNDDVEVKIRDLLLGKQSGTENTEKETTSDVVQTPETISEEKLEKWEDACSISARWGLHISWFYDWIQWFKDWLDRRAKALYPVEDAVERKEKKRVQG